MRFRTIVLTALLVLLATAPAQGASRLVVRGGGFGHGIGMSQYGALGFAQNGYDHAFILGHYYKGTRLGTLGRPRRVRVLLQSAGRVSFSARRTCPALARWTRPRPTRRRARGAAA